MGMSPSRFGMLQLWNESGRTSLLSTTGCVFRPVCAVFFCAAPPPPIVPIPWQTWPRKGGISWVPLRTQETNTGINRMGCLCLFMVDGEVTVSNEMELIIVNSLYKNAISSPKFDFQVRKMGWSWADYHPGSLDSNWGISPQVPQDSTRGFKTQVSPPCFPDISVRSVIFLDNLQWFIHGKIIYKHGFFPLPIWLPNVGLFSPGQGAPCPVKLAAPDVAPRWSFPNEPRQGWATEAMVIDDGSDRDFRGKTMENHGE